MTLAAGGVDVWLSRRGRVSSGQVPRPGQTGSLPDSLTAPEIRVEEDPYLNIVAEAAAPQIPVFDAPGAGRPSLRLAGRDQYSIRLVFLVIKRKGDWLRVHLPVRPNGSKGWIRSKDVTLSEHRYRIVVMLKQHRLLAFKGGSGGEREAGPWSADLIMRTKIAVGKEDTPTPGGSYYIKELFKLPNPNTVYGTYAYGLSGFSDVLTSFAGGEGVIGIHGTNDPSVLGTDVSAGCIRMRNRDIERLVTRLPLGTPVDIIR